MVKKYWLKKSLQRQSVKASGGYNQSKGDFFIMKNAVPS
nr:MAG TPA: hypothetical protein [Bacteriophage sp.]